MTVIGLIIREGGGQFCEFKRGLSAEICALANSAGGRIYSEIDDNTTVSEITGRQPAEIPDNRHGTQLLPGNQHRLFYA